MKKGWESTKGFGLIELAIVVTVISFVASGILVGRHLVRHAQVLAVISQVKGFQTAINAFKIQYDYLPGDFPLATSYWGDATENGDGDGIIQEIGFSSGNEGTRAWQHLALAGILPASFSGSGKQVESVTIPVSKLDGGGFYFRARPKNVLHSGIDKPFIEWGTCKPGTTVECDGGIITPEEAQMLDRKMDDGFATSGVVFGYNGFPEAKYPHCSGNWDTPVGSVDYQMQYKSDRHCRMDFWLF